MPKQSTITHAPQADRLGSGLWVRVKTWLPLGLFSILWLDLIHQLSYEWSSNEQYAYGWFVPLLSLGLLWRKWSTRPPALLPDLRPLRSPLSVSVSVTALLLLPIRVIHEINQDWPLFSWPLALGVVVISLYAMFLAGGWPWVRHFAFPIGFILVAINWPYRLENGLTHGLMRLVVGVTVSLLSPLDVVASQRGSLIELSTGVVGVDEACSGIRSFQATVMGSLFLGELYLLRWPQRLALLASGTLLAFCLNVGRTLILTWQASAAGVEALKKWHDPAGFTIFLSAFALLWAVAWLLKRRSDSVSVDRHATPVGSLRPIRGYLLAVGCWSLCILFTNEVWYRAHDLRQLEPVRWWVNFPTNLTTYSSTQVPEGARKLLKYDQGTAASWKEADGTKWQAFCFRWQAGDPTARMSALGHRPEYCLTGAGHELKADLGTRLISTAGLDLPFRTYIFDDSERTLYVFFCLWEDAAEKQLGFGRSKYLDRLHSVLTGRRGLGQQTLEIVVSGCANIKEAERALGEGLPGLINRQTPVPEKALLARKS